MGINWDLISLAFSQLSKERSYLGHRLLALIWPQGVPNNYLLLFLRVNWNGQHDTIQVTPYRGLFIAPGTVMVEFPGMHSGPCLLPTITLPIKPSLFRGKFFGLFLLEG